MMTLLFSQPWQLAKTGMKPNLVGLQPGDPGGNNLLIRTGRARKEMCCPTKTKPGMIHLLILALIYRWTRSFSAWRLSATFYENSNLDVRPELTIPSCFLQVPKHSEVSWACFPACPFGVLQPNSLRPWVTL